MTKAYSCLHDPAEPAMEGLSMQRMVQDLREAQSLQAHARPHNGQTIAGLQFEYSIIPARYLSGDALDFFRLPDGRVLAYLLDVSGQGAAAALLSMFIKSSVRHSMVMSPANGPAEVLTDVNRMLLDAGMHKYATMLCFILSPQGNSLEWSHAGHMPRPILLEQGRARLLQGQGQPVGLFADACYESERIDVEGDFSLCLFTDGVLGNVAGTTLNMRENALAGLVEQTQGQFEPLLQALGLQDATGNGEDDRSVFVIGRATHG